MDMQARRKKLKKIMDDGDHEYRTMPGEMSGVDQPVPESQWPKHLKKPLRKRMIDEMPRGAEDDYPSTSNMHYVPRSKRVRKIMQA